MGWVLCSGAQTWLMQVIKCSTQIGPGVWFGTSNDWLRWVQGSEKSESV